MYNFLCVYFFNTFLNMCPWGHKLTLPYFNYERTSLNALKDLSLCWLLLLQGQGHLEGIGQVVWLIIVSVMTLVDHINCEHKLTFFLLGLNEDFSQICSQILLMELFPSISHIFLLWSKNKNNELSILLLLHVKNSLVPQSKS